LTVLAAAAYAPQRNGSDRNAGFRPHHKKEIAGGDGGVLLKFKKTLDFDLKLAKNRYLIRADQHQTPISSDFPLVILSLTPHSNLFFLLPLTLQPIGSCHLSFQLH
jgi:hypothetical protein